MALIMGIYLFVLAAEDMVIKNVHVALLAAGAIPVAVSLFAGEGAGCADRLAGLAVGLAMLLAAKLTKEKIGYGDAVVFCIAGLTLGARRCLAMTGIALFILLAYSVTMLARGVLNRNSRVPFLPFMFAGYVLMQFGQT